MEKCHGLAGFIFGHKFQPRYSTEGEGNEKIAFELLKELQNLTYSSDKVPLLRKYMDERKNFIKREYLNDVCVRCGKLTNRIFESGNERMIQL